VRPPDESARHFRDSLCRALGPAVVEALSNPDVSEIYANASGHLYFDTRSAGRTSTDIRLTAEQILRFLNLVGSRIPTVLNASRPAIQAELPQEGFLGARLQGFIPPLAAAPCFNLRKPPSTVYSLDDYERAEILSPAHRRALGDAVRRRRNVLV